MQMPNGGVLAMASSPSDDLRPAAPRGSRNRYRRWTDAEDAILLRAIKVGRTYDEIVGMLDGRRRPALINRVHKLRKDGDENVVDRRRGRPHSTSREAPAIFEAMPVRPIIDGTEELLRALLRFGANRPGIKGLEGLPHDRFVELCAIHRIAVPA